MQDDDSLIELVALLIIWQYPVVDVWLSISRPAMSTLHHFEHFALKFPMTIEKTRC